MLFQVRLSSPVFAYTRQHPAAGNIEIKYPASATTPVWNEKAYVLLLLQQENFRFTLKTEQGISPELTNSSGCHLIAALPG